MPIIALDIRGFSMSENKDRILVVEDSPPNRKILVHLLEKLNYVVDSFEDGKEAWDYLNDNPPSDLVAIISDIMMPQMDGVQLLKHVREDDKWKDMPFVLVTAVSDRDYIIEAKALNVNGYILKPVTFQRVTNKLKEIFPEKKFPKAAS
ncbi:MAG: response regulator [Bdellovibrionaceae bacterium]|nr:response regulator [Pseudobdellovibrionaceae bacterium]|tara:strand:+ start:17452 stop:17898 length:447 start_codon:yes stop_codon:yes gene_type:complete